MNDITSIEKKAGIIANSKSDLPKVTNPSDLVAYALDNLDKLHPVNYDDRLKFLLDNGYEPTRSNFINTELSARQLSE